VVAPFGRRVISAPPSPPTPAPPPNRRRPLRRDSLFARPTRQTAGGTGGLRSAAPGPAPARRRGGLLTATATANTEESAKPPALSSVLSTELSSALRPEGRSRSIRTGVPKFPLRGRFHHAFAPTLAQKSPMQKAPGPHLVGKKRSMAPCGGGAGRPRSNAFGCGTRPWFCAPSRAFSARARCVSPYGSRNPRAAPAVRVYPASHPLPLMLPHASSSRALHPHPSFAFSLTACHLSLYSAASARRPLSIRPRVGRGFPLAPCPSWHTR